MNNAFKGNIAPLNFEAWQEKEFEKLVKKGRTVTCPSCDGDGLEWGFACSLEDEELDVCGQCDGDGTVFAEDVKPHQVDELSRKEYRLQIAEDVFYLSRHTQTNFFENLCKVIQIRTPVFYR